MKKFEDFILHGCGFAVLLALILYIFLAIGGVVDQGIPITKFLVVLGYGLVISGARELYASLPYGKAVRVAIHYSMLLAGFLILYFTSGAFPTITGARIFIAIVLFSIFYTAVMLSMAGIYKLMQKSKPTSSPTAKNGGGKQPREKAEYKPRFSGDSK